MKTLILIAALFCITAWLDGYMKGQVRAEERIVERGDLIDQLELADARTELTMKGR